MRIAAGLLVVLVACGGDPEMFPVGGGGDGGTTGDGNRPIDARLIDARVVDAAPLPVDANLFQGRVCLLTDARRLNVCASTGADGLTVRLDNATAVTAADGSFTIAGGTGTWRVTGANIVSSYMLLADYQIPAITKTMFTAMLTTNNVMLVSGEGSLMVQVVKNGAGLSGATAAAALPNVPFYAPWYDGGSSAAWQQTATQANGAVWMAGLDVGETTVTVTPGTGTPITAATQPIFDDGITFTTVIFP